MGTKKLVIEVPGEIKCIKDVSSEVLNMLSPYDIDNDRLFDIRLCTEEALRNAIEHGNDCNKKLPVKISCWVDDGKVNIEVEDKGSGYNPGLIPDPTDNGNLMKNSGRGVYLIKRLMDEVKFNKAGNVITMMKRIE
ncbi:MAG: ATP-binding protein [Candidatus Omnitrophota bacterium]|jgi:serine/threonine-protein kinase RsbW